MVHKKTDEVNLHICTSTPSFYEKYRKLSLMSNKQFFINRYEELGWKYEDVSPRLAIRINTMNVDKTEAILQRLRSIGIALERISFLDHGYWVCKSKFSSGATSEYLLGLYSIQEAAAQIPVNLFTELRDKTVLDACAAPGGKTVQLADSMHNTGAIIALDIRRQRLTALTNHLERCRVKNTIVYFLDSRQVSELKTSFDRILLDMPCSGNFAADKNWFNRRTINDVERNARLQREILAETVRVLRDSGEIVYSTCSLEPEENELNIDWAVRTLSLQVEEIDCYGQKALTNVFGKHLDSSVEKCRRIWPGHTQGFFVCKLKRRKVA
jgi:NOL1/NOP2/sun family putative RNA methylase